MLGLIFLLGLGVMLGLLFLSQLGIGLRLMLGLLFFYSEC